MDWLMHNPIADLDGPTFLVVYAAFITMVVWHARWSLQRDDTSADLGPLPIPSKPDPRALAYLRGGPHELKRLMVFDLLRRGFLQATGTERIERAPDPPREGGLSRLDRCILAFFAVARKPEELFQRGKLA